MTEEIFLSAPGGKRIKGRKAGKMDTDAGGEKARGSNKKGQLRS